MSGICSFIQMHMFNIAGERLTKRVRSNLFRAILNQEQGWFDNEINGVGAICTRLSNDAAYVQGVRVYNTRLLLPININEIVIIFF